MELLTAFTLGLFGSLHCIGMCGPIAMALPHSGISRWSTVSNLLLYNSGRVVTYGFIGAFFGIIGLGVALAGYQQIISITLGVVILFAALFSFNLDAGIVKLPVLDRFFFKIKSELGHRLKNNGNGSFFIIGLLNGFLPCGMVYMALAGAVLAGSVAGGAAFMILFGIGTIPLMLTASLARGLISLSLRRKLRKMVPAFLAIIAIMLIFRGIGMDFASGMAH